jgi:hypothetical protein
MLRMGFTLSFAEEKLEAIWQKAKQFPNPSDPGWAKDDCGAWIQRSTYGDRNSLYGWEVDHIQPESRGGSNELSNLRPLHWENNANKAAGCTECIITSSGDKNIRVG